MQALTETVGSRLVDESAPSLHDTAPRTAGTHHPYRAWILLGVFAVGAAFWVAVGLVVLALMQ